VTVEAVRKATSPEPATNRVTITCYAKARRWAPVVVCGRRIDRIGSPRGKIRREGAMTRRKTRRIMENEFSASPLPSRLRVFAVNWIAFARARHCARNG
jgi:hypothetical protein